MIRIYGESFGALLLEQFQFLLDHSDIYIRNAIVITLVVLDFLAVD